jgi:hypothetical protein
MSAPNRGIVETSLKDPDYLSTRIIKIYRPDKRDHSAIFLHGWRCNKNMWFLLARYLARSGTVCYLIDAPGHGESKITFDNNWIGSMIWSVGALIQREHVNLDRTAFIGHSMGGQFIMHPHVITQIPVGSNISLEGWQLKTIPQFGYLRNPLLTRPRNLLEAESKKFVWREKQITLFRLAGHLKPYKNFRSIYGDPNNFTAVGLARLPDDVAHMTLTWNKKAFELTEWWLNLSILTDRPNGQPYSSPWLQSGVIASLLLFLFLTLFLSKKTVPYGQAYLHGQTLAANPKWPTSSFSILALAALAGNYYTELNGVTLGILDIPDAFPWMLYMVICSALLLVLNFRTLQPPSWKRVLFSLLAALSLFLLAYFTGGTFIDRHLFALEIPPQRLGRFILIAAVLMPYFLMEESFLRTMQSRQTQDLRGMSRTVLVSLAFRSFQLSLLFHSYDPMLRLMILFIGITAVTQLASFFVYRYYANSITTGFFNALVFSWIIVVSFPISLLI